MPRYNTSAHKASITADLDIMSIISKGNLSKKHIKALGLSSTNIVNLDRIINESSLPDQLKEALKAGVALSIRTYSGQAERPQFVEMYTSSLLDYLNDTISNLHLLMTLLRNLVDNSDGLIPQTTIDVVMNNLCIRISEYTMFENISPDVSFLNDVIRKINKTHTDKLSSITDESLGKQISDLYLGDIEQLLQNLGNIEDIKQVGDTAYKIRQLEWSFNQVVSLFLIQDQEFKEILESKIRPFINGEIDKQTPQTIEELRSIYIAELSIDQRASVILKLSNDLIERSNLPDQFKEALKTSVSRNIDADKDRFGSQDEIREYILLLQEQVPRIISGINQFMASLENLANKNDNLIPQTILDTFTDNVCAQLAKDDIKFSKTSKLIWYLSKDFIKSINDVQTGKLSNITDEVLGKEISSLYFGEMELLIRSLSKTDATTYSDGIMIDELNESLKKLISLISTHGIEFQTTAERKLRAIIEGERSNEQASINITGLGQEVITMLLEEIGFDEIQVREKTEELDRIIQQKHFEYEETKSYLSFGFYNTMKCHSILNYIYSSLNNEAILRKIATIPNGANTLKNNLEAINKAFVEPYKRYLSIAKHITTSRSAHIAIASAITLAAVASVVTTIFLAPAIFIPTIVVAGICSIIATAYAVLPVTKIGQKFKKEVLNKIDEKLLDKIITRKLEAIMKKRFNLSDILSLARERDNPPQVEIASKLNQTPQTSEHSQDQMTAHGASLQQTRAQESSVPKTRER